MKLRIYLDTCAIQRPLDTKDQLRITLEAEAVLGILSLIESGKVDLISSEVLSFETNRNSNQIRKEYALEVLSKAKDFIEVDAKTEKRTGQITEFGIKLLDASHLACAEEAEVDYFCTCDKVKIISALDLVKEL